MCYSFNKIISVMKSASNSGVIIVSYHHSQSPLLPQIRHIREMLHRSESFLLCFYLNRVIHSIQNCSHYYYPTCAESHKAAPCLTVWDCSMWLKADTRFLERLPAVKDVWPSHIYKHCVCLWWPEMPGTPACLLSDPLVATATPSSQASCLLYFPFQSRPKIGYLTDYSPLCFQSLPRQTGKLVQEKGCQECRDESLFESQIHLGWLRLWWDFDATQTLNLRVDQTATLLLFMIHHFQSY